MDKQSRILALTTLLLMVSGHFILLIYHISDLAKGRDNSDFATFYASGKLVAHPRGLYAPAVGQIANEDVGPIRPNSHLPYEAILFLPFRYLSYKAASLLWIVFGIGIFFVSSKVLEREFPYLRQSLDTGFGIVTFAFFPTLMVFLWGQDSAVLFLLIVLSYRQFVRGQDVSCGVFLGLAMFKFQYIVPLIAIIALRRKWKVVYGFMPAAALVLLISWLMIGNAGAVSYWKILIANQGELVWRMPNIRGAVEMMGGSPAIIVLLSAMVVVWFGFAKIEDRQAQFSLAIVGAELVSLHGHIYDMVLALIPILYLWNRLARAGKPNLWMLSLFLSPVYIVLARYQAWYLLCIPLLGLGWSVIVAANKQENDKYTTAVAQV